MRIFSLYILQIKWLHFRASPNTKMLGAIIINVSNVAFYKIDGTQKGRKRDSQTGT